MALVQIADVIVPEIYQGYQAVDTVEKTALFESGIIVRNAFLDANAVEGGNTVNIPFWNDIVSTLVPNLSDDTSNAATPNKITAGKQIARSAYLNQFFQAADLAGELAGSDPMQRIRNRFGKYWAIQFQKRLIATTNGLLADNLASNSGDMVKSVAAESIAAQTAATKFNRDAFTDAVYTLGDAASTLTAIAVHSAVMSQMAKNDDIVYIPDSKGALTIPTYMGLRVIMDDGLTVTAGSTDGFKYTSVLFGAGMFGYGEGSPKVPVEITREALQGNGGGVEHIGERKTWLLHPAGYQNTGTPAGNSFTLAELALATTWSRVVPRKNLPLAFLISN